jgi:hypothetical protein
MADAVILNRGEGWHTDSPWDIWDNRCTVHSAAGGYSADERRIHWRTTIMQ